MEKKPVRRRPPRSLQLKKPEEQSDEEKHAGASPHAPKGKPRNSPRIEKLQANLALAPTALLPPSKSPEMRLQPTSSPTSPTLRLPSPALFPSSPALSPSSPALFPSSPALFPSSPALSPSSPAFFPSSPTLFPSSPALFPSSPTLCPPSPGLSPALLSEEEAPVSFEDPPESSVLPCFNKDRARLSFRRRPPSRQHRKSCGEEAGAAGGGSSPCRLDGQRRTEGEEGAPEKTSRKTKRVRVRKASGRNTDKRDGAERADKTQPGAAGHSEAITGEVKRAGNEASAQPEGEGLKGEPCPEDNLRASRKEGEETKPQEGEGLSPDEDEPEGTGD